ncbi:MAG: LETM1-related biofilm-associated protein [Crocinitomicaceae bacterium]|nr:LETM1-related biofilm-associated protein [Crocinitomicaceae bacterium]
MLSPGSKGWINKYFDLERRNEFSLEFSVPNGLTRKEYVHFSFLRSGIVFGFPVKRIFANELKDSKWTQNEKLKVLLFESFLLIYLMENKDDHFDLEKFKASLLSFYAEHKARGLSKVFGLFLKETPDERLENILTQRLSVKSKLIEGQYWLGYLSNAFVYLDIVLYRNFLKNRKETLSNYNELADNALVAITMAAYSDDIITDQEKAMFKVFLSSANLKDSEKKVAKERFKHGASLSDFSEIAKSNVLFRRFLIDITALTIFVNEERLPEEIPFFNEMCDFLDVPKKEVHNAMTMIENFVLQNSNQMSLLSSSSSYEKLYGSVSKRWVKVLSRNSDKLALELKESKELVQLIRKSTSEELSKEEKELVKSQFMDIMKSMPALAIFMLPGGALLLPLILKIIPDLVPSAFRDNELDEEPK